MAPEERSPFENMAREAVLAAFTNEAEATPDRIAQTICGLISAASRKEGEAQAGIVAATRGGMSVVLTGNHNAAETAGLILAGLSEMSLMTRVGPTDLMSWTLEGVAEAVIEIAPDQRHPIAEKVEERFHGVGAVFTGLCDQAEKARKPPAAP